MRFACLFVIALTLTLFAAACGEEYRVPVDERPVEFVGDPTYSLVPTETRRRAWRYTGPFEDIVARPVSLAQERPRIAILAGIFMIGLIWGSTKAILEGRRPKKSADDEDLHR